MITRNSALTTYVVHAASGATMTTAPTDRAEHDGGDVTPSMLVVFRANGGTGRAVVRQALAAGHRVRAVTRHPDAFPRSEVLPADAGGSPIGDHLQVVSGDATDPASVADAVLSALGTPFTRQPVQLYSASADALIAGMRRHDVRRLAVVSSANAATDGPSQGFAYDHVVDPVVTRVLGRTLYDDMRRMEAAVRASDLDWTIVRPSGLSDTEGSATTGLAARPWSARRPPARTSPTSC